MANTTRKRMISPTIWDDPEFISLSIPSRLLFIGLISNADDEGRLRGNPAYLKKMIFGYDRMSILKVGKLRDETVQKMKNVVLYQVNGEEYIELKQWRKHQYLRNDRPGWKSELPPSGGGQVVGSRPSGGGQVSAQDKIREDKITNVAKSDGGAPFSFKEKLKEMEKDECRHIQIIALYWKYKGIEPENHEQYRSFLERELKPARKLVGFSDKRILEVMGWLQNENTFKWTLETVMKYIGENLKQIKPIR